jgi:hypothetical protein
LAGGYRAGQAFGREPPALRHETPARSGRAAHFTFSERELRVVFLIALADL